MSGTVEQEREIPPKRQRMLDMLMVLGGLKEEQAIPLSRVKEEIEALKAGLTPLISEILSFPDKYNKAFLETAERIRLAEQLTDHGIVTEAITRLEEALSIRRTDALEGLLNLLRSTQQKDETTAEERPERPRMDIGQVIEPLSGFIETVEDAIAGYETERNKQAQEALDRLHGLTEEFRNLVRLASENPEEALDGLRKMGTITRYGPFLRNAGQIRRALKEGRVTPARFAELVQTNMLVEMIRGLIMFVLNNVGSKTVMQLAEILDLEPERVQNAIITMIQRGEIKMVGVEEGAPVYARVLGTVPNTLLVLKRISQQMRSLLRNAEGSVRDTLEDAVGRLTSCLEKLQRLGQYDEAAIAEAVNEMREIADRATEAALSTESSADTEELRHLISAGLEAFARFRLRITLEKGPNLVEGKNVYGESLDPEVYRRMMDTYLENEIERGFILVLIRELGAMSVKDISERTKIPPDRVLQHVLRMKRDELLTIAGEEHGYVLYDVPRTPNEAEVAIQTITALIQDLAPAMRDLEQLVAELTAKDIGRLVNTLEAFSKARDKMAKITLGGSAIASDTIEAVRESIRSALAMAYRTRARIPSTRPKVTIDDLIDVDVPTVMDEYRDMMGYAPLLGFGTIDWDQSKCLGCRSCELSCPEDAIFLRPVIDLPEFFEFSEEVIDRFPSVRAMFYRTLRGLAVKRPTSNIVLEHDAPGFGHVEVDLWLCVACRTCVRRCPGPEGGALELDLKWSLPEVIRHLVTEQTSE